jgi:starch synthase
MKIFIVTPEAVPYAKTGGLADVTGSLLKEFRKLGMDARLIMPFYSVVANSSETIDTGIRLSLNILSENITASLLESRRNDYPAYFIRCDRFFMREGLYGTSSRDYPDNALRFSFFSRTALLAIKALSMRPDIIHVHDWQTALVPFYLKNFYRDEPLFKDTRTVLTIHNLGYQGLFHPSLLPYTGIGLEHFVPHGIEFYGKINFLKAGIISSDAITTVSESYAKEILTEEYGFGLHGVLRERASRLYGILNGIDYTQWDPETDRSIHRRFSLRDLRGKKACKRDLIKKSALKIKELQPLACFIGRFVSQKGIDLIEKAVPELIKAGFGLIILGSGERTYEEAMLNLYSRFRDYLYVKIGYDEDLARNIYGGSDIFIMPSRYEPCGLTQMIAMRYGTIPVGRATGGLIDTIQDYDHLRRAGTGFLFREYSPSAMIECLKRALCVYSRTYEWNKIIKVAMKKDFSWSNSALKYLSLFRILKAQEPL